MHRQEVTDVDSSLKRSLAKIHNEHDKLTDEYLAYVGRISGRGDKLVDRVLYTQGLI